MPRLVLDIDGVLANGQYIPENERTVDKFIILNRLYKEIYFQELSRIYDIYLITARTFTDAYWWTNKWLGFSSVFMKGLFTGIRASEKASIIMALHPTVVVDDSPIVMDSLRSEFVHPELILFDNPFWPENQAYDRSGVLRVKSWDELYNYLISRV